MRASTWLLSLSLLSGAFAMLAACVGGDNVAPPDASSDATTDVTPGDGSPGDAPPHGNMDFGTGPHAAVGSTDGFVVDLKNQAGAPAWEKYFSGTGFALSTDSTLSPIDGVTIPAPQSTAAAALIGKIDSSGKLLWVNGVSRVVRTTSTVSTSTASRSEQMATPKRSAHSMARSISDRAPRRRASARDRIRI